MLNHDPDWGFPLSNWQPAPSFRFPIAVPASGPDAGTALCLPPINQAWLPIVIGCLDQLRLPTTWGDISDADMEQVLSWAEQLKLIVSRGGACIDVQIRLQDCILQYSTDGGATWTDVANWATGEPACITATAWPGGTGTGPFGPPGNPQGVSVSQQACNIAAYLAIEVVDVSIQQALTAIAGAIALVDYMGGLLEVLGVLNLVLGVAVFAGAALFTAIEAGTASHYTAALADASFKSDVQCAFYDAIEADGYVTSANFAAILTNIAGIPYTHADVVSSVHDYVSNLGVGGLQVLQHQGSLYVGDCAACGRNANALRFSHLDPNYVLLTSDVGLGSGDWTIGGWIQSPAGGAYPAALFFSGNNAPSPTVCGQMSIGCYSTFNVGVNVQQSSCSGWFCAGTVTINDGANHHIVATRTGGTLRVYCDGALLQTAATGGGGSLVGGGGQQTMLGAGNNNFGGGTLQQYAEATMWAWAAYVGTRLTDAQIAAWHAAGTFGDPPITPTHFWTFGEGSGTAIADSIGGNNGTLHGTPHWVTHA